MKIAKLSSIFMLLLISLACTTKSDTRKKTEPLTFEYYFAQSGNLMENSPTQERISGDIVLDDIQKKVTITANGTNFMLEFKIIGKNDPVLIGNYNDLGFNKMGFSECKDAYLLSLVNDPNDIPYALFFSSDNTHDFAILMRGTNCTFYAGSFRKN
jgi:hypothetical protein